MLKKLLSLIIAGAIMVGSAVSALAVDYGEEYKNQPTKTYSQVFSDVSKGHWAFSYIGEMNQRGVISGYPNGQYYPENYVTRAEFAKIMCVAAGLTINEVSSTSYYDVAPNEWYASYIETGKYYLSGYLSNGTNYYHPDDNALREDIAVALVKLKGYSTVGADESILKTMFTDWHSISVEARKYVAAALENGLISGYDDNTFRGQDSITRAEAATLLWRAYQYGNGNKTFDDAKDETITPVVTTEPTKAPTTPQKEVVYDYSIELSPTKLTVDEGEEAKITIELSDEAPTGADYSKFETDCKSADIQKSKEDGKLCLTVSFDTSMPGKENYSFSYKDKSKKFSLIINEVQKYSWKVDTVATKVDFVDKASGYSYSSDIHHSYNLVEAKDSVLYTDGTTLFEADEDGNNAILCLDDFEWQGEEKSKKDELTQRICSYAYNFYDDNIYAIINQYCNGSITMLYNVTNEEIVCQLKQSTSLDKILGFYKDGTIQTPIGKVINDGSFVSENYNSNFDKYWVYNNSLYLYQYNSCEGPHMWYELKKYDLSINSFKEIDTDTEEYFDIASPAMGCLYKVQDKTIKKMDTNGDSQELLNFEQVRVDDGKKIDTLNGMVIDSEESIYFYDSNYKSIRKISKIK